MCFNATILLRPLPEKHYSHNHNYIVKVVSYFIQNDYGCIVGGGGACVTSTFVDAIGIVILIIIR